MLPLLRLWTAGLCAGACLLASLPGGARAMRRAPSAARSSARRAPGERAIAAAGAEGPQPGDSAVEQAAGIVGLSLADVAARANAVAPPLQHPHIGQAIASAARRLGSFDSIASFTSSGSLGSSGSALGAVVRVPWTQPGLLRHIDLTCGADIQPKDIGASASSSKSGAVWYNCAEPDAASQYGRVLIKSGIRDTSSAPEWQAFQNMAGALEERYSQPTLLNKMLMGFDAFGLHWLVLDDVEAQAQRLVSRLPNGLVQEEPTWSVFDIKPLGSTSPRLAPCLLKLHEVASVMGPIKNFDGWDRLLLALDRDLAFLQARESIDESLFVQVAGPFRVDARTAAAERVRVEAALKEATPMCAHKLDVVQGLMAVVCVTVLDYLMYMSWVKEVQNVLQIFRWNRYETKMQTMMMCLGDALGPACEDYRVKRAEQWRSVVAHRYWADGGRAALNMIESEWRCCCHEPGPEGFDMNTLCTWMQGDQLGWFGICPLGLDHRPALEGGCEGQVPRGWAA